MLRLSIDKIIAYVNITGDCTLSDLVFGLEDMFKLLACFLVFVKGFYLTGIANKNAKDFAE